MSFLYTLFQKTYHRFRKIKIDRHLKKLVSRGLIIGEGCNFVEIESLFLDPSHCYLISIGNQCIIAPNVRFIAHDASTKLFINYTKFARIEVKESTFIGDSAIILPGVTIGPNSIVAAGAVVTKDVPANTIVAGNPAHIIGRLDEYLAKIEALRQGKKVFDESYYIENLTEDKRRELINSIGHDFGMIV
jgi:maltose O-acetyltransferase